MKRQISLLWSANFPFVLMKHDFLFQLGNCVSGGAAGTCSFVGIAVCAVDVDVGFTLISCMHDQIDDWNALYHT